MSKILRKRHKIKQHKSVLKKRSFWLMILLFVLISVVFYFVVVFDKFQIKKIIISGNEKITTNEIEKLVFEKIKKQVLFWKHGERRKKNQTIFG